MTLTNQGTTIREQALSRAECIYFVERYLNGERISSRGYRSLVGARIRWQTLTRIWPTYNIRIIYRYEGRIEDVTPRGTLASSTRDGGIR